ncbi:MAG: CapA family protein [Clostridia bacterium]|jgi:poly-gamma-glutamate synthesis protein (capsule biosynthesis protein)|nr:CapA family protein [Clostridia bacterium]MCI2015768.1 CapA family protein [Clostridia bacterium]
MNPKRKNTERFKILLLLIPLIFLFTSCGQSQSISSSSELSSSYISSAESSSKIEPEPTPPVVHTASLAVIGDMMVHSYQYNESYDSKTGTYEFDHNFAAVKKYLQAADYCIGNLETVLGGEDIGISDYPNFNTPDSFAEAAKRGGVNFVTTANNHCADRGTDSLLRTLDELDKVGIDHTGTYRSQAERDNIFIKDINGIKFAFLSYTYGTNGMPYANSYNVNILSDGLVKSDIKRAKEENPDFIVVLPHMGVEYQTQPNAEQKRIVDMMFKAGADIILASHPHVLQPMEVRDIADDDGNTRKGFVIYSLGNFISSQTTPPRNASIILNIDTQKVGDKKAEITKISFIPIWTQFRNGKNQNDFVVRSVYDVLSLPESEQKENFRAKDLQRLRDIHYETTSLLLNKNIPIKYIQNEYVFYQKDEKEVSQ